MVDNGNNPGSRQKRTIVKFYNAEGTLVKSCYCRRCMETKKPNRFLDATDANLDKNGKMSICAECLNDLFVRTFNAEQDVSKTILILCRMLNVAYLENAVKSTLSHVAKLYEKSDNPDLSPIFSFYKAKMSSLTQMNQSGILTFSEPVKFKSLDPMGNDEIPDTEELKQFWGDGLSFDDYSYLEKELDEWKKTHKSDTKAEETLLKELCYKGLEIRKQRIQGTSTAGSVKELQDLMKTASVDPAKAGIAGAGKSQDTFSAFIKTIEENEPADYYKDKKLFKDYDNIDWYFRKFVSVPLSNFVGISRDFNLGEDNIDSDIDNFDGIIPEEILGDDKP